MIQKEAEISAQKQALISEKQVSAKLQAENQSAKSQRESLDSLQASQRELSQKLLMKDEEMKKVHIQMQALKSTIGDLEEGIETYQAYAEDKGRSNEELTKTLDTESRLSINLGQKVQELEALLRSV